MKKILYLLIALPAIAFGQIGYNITSWNYNNTGHQAQYYSSDGVTVNNLNDSSEVQQICYNTDSIYVRTNILAKYIMGPWPGDPFTADGQNNAYVFPRNPAYPSSTHQTKPTGAMGLLINGVILYDDGDGKSYNSSTGTNTNNGSGVWNQIAWVAHADEMDSGNGHPDPNNIYHNHSNPIQLCSVTTATAHSPIIGWAFDGWPIYGPFGYSSAMDNTSAITRMTSSWSLRNITTRTTFYDGSTASQTGPAVSTSFPLGTYIEDYGYTASSGNLDYYNGRYCVTPEFPSGTYAYFLNTDASGNASYPNMIGPKYYGSVYLTNFGTGSGNATLMKAGVSCYSPSVGITVNLSASTNVTCNGGSNGSATVSASGGSGSYTYSWSPSGGSAATASSLSAGTYTCTVADGTYTSTQTVTITQPSAPTITSTVTSPTCNGGTTGAIDATVSSSVTTPGLVISEILADPAGTDSPFEFVELIATKAINFATTPYTVIFSNNGTATSNGWVAGGSLTYAFQISSGSVTQGQVVYVGGSSMTPTSNILRSINTSTTAGDGSIGNANGTGVLGNGGPAADGVAVFNVGTSSLTSSSVPVDAIFYGTAAGAAVVSSGSAGYQLPVNDAYTSGGKLQSSSFVATTYTTGQYLKATGTYNLASGSWTTGRTWSATTSFTNLASSVSLAGSNTYSWSNGATTEDISSIGAGTYTLTVTDGNSCPTSQTITVTQPTAISTSVTSNSVTCNGASTGTATVTASGGTGSLSYSWSPSGGSAATASSLAANTYTCTVTDGNSCTKTQTVTISQPTAISASVTSGSVTCNGTSTGTATVTASGGTGSLSYSWSPSGGSAATASSLAANTYTCTITDANSCTTTKTVTISQPTAISSSVISGSVTCNGASTGIASVTASGGTGTLSYSWSPSGGSAASASSLAAGTYTCTISDANSCTRTQSVTISQPTALSASASAGSILCNGGNATVTVSASGGTPSYSGTGSFTVSAGSYTYTVSDANGCSSNASVSITQPTAISASLSSQTSASCGGSDGSATVTASGGTGSLSYSWSPSGGSTATGSNMAAGTYTCTITDANSCSTTQTVTITNPGAVTSSITSTSVTCNGGANGSATVTANGGTGTLTYAWSPSGGSAATASNLAAGSYTCTITDAASCVSTQSVTITEPTALSATATAGSILCNGNNATVTVSASGGTAAYSGTGTFTVTAGSYTYTVTDANGCSASSNVTLTEPSVLSASSSATSVVCNGANAIVTVSATGGTAAYSGAGSYTVTAGSYTYTVTDANGCTASTSVNISEPTAIAVSVSSTSILCNGDSAVVTISASGGSPSYTGTGNYTTAAGTYTYTVTDANGCIASITSTITEPALITQTNTYTICSGDQVTVGSHTYTASGIYSDTLSSSGGCDSIVVTNLTVNSSVNISTTTNSTTITAAQGGAVYQWIDCDNSGAAISGETSQSFTASSNGNYAVIVSIGSCSDTSACVAINGVGLRENNSGVSIDLYPNPNNGEFRIRLSSDAQVLICNAIGEVLLDTKLEKGLQEIKLQNPPNGVYFIKVQSSEKQCTHRLVISN